MLLSRLLLFVITIVIGVIGDEDIVTNYVRCSTTKGPMVLEIHRDWSPRGADRFIDLVKDGFFKDIALYRCVDRFLTQFGISDNPAMKHWHNDEILDDKNLHKGIKRGYLSFAGGGKNTRSSQLFIAFEDLDFLGKEPWETPFGKVTEGIEVLDKFYKGYGDMPPFGKGPDQQKLHNRGNSYIRNEFPLIDFIEQCELVEKKVQYFKEEEGANKNGEETAVMEPRIQPDNGEEESEEESEELEQDRRIRDEEQEHIHEHHNGEEQVEIESEETEESENGDDEETESADDVEETESADVEATEEEEIEETEGSDDENAEEEREEEEGQLYIHKRPRVLKKHNRNEDLGSFLDRQNVLPHHDKGAGMVGAALLFSGLAVFLLAQYTGKSKTDPFNRDRYSKRNI